MPGGEVVKRAEAPAAAARRGSSHAGCWLATRLPARSGDARRPSAAAPETPWYRGDGGDRAPTGGLRALRGEERRHAPPRPLRWLRPAGGEIGRRSDAAACRRRLLANRRRSPASAARRRSAGLGCACGGVERFGCAGLADARSPVRVAGGSAPLNMAGGGRGVADGRRQMDENAGVSPADDVSAPAAADEALDCRGVVASACR